MNGEFTNARRLMDGIILKALGAERDNLAQCHKRVVELEDALASLGSLHLWHGNSNNDEMPTACVNVVGKEFEGLTVAEAAEQLIRRAARPMHARELHTLLNRGGLDLTSPSSFQSVVTSMNRHVPDLFLRVRPNTFSLAPAAEQNEIFSEAATEDHDMVRSTFSDRQDGVIRELYKRIRVTPERLVSNENRRVDFMKKYRKEAGDKSHTDEEIYLRLFNLRRSARLDRLGHASAN